MQHYWTAALSGSCWLLVLAAALMRVVLAACISSDTHEARLVHLSIPARWLLVLATAPIHRCSIIGLQHFLGRAGCSYWQRLLCASHMMPSRLSVCDSPTVSDGCTIANTDLFQHAGCSFSSSTMHPCSIVGLQHFLVKPRSTKLTTMKQSQKKQGTSK
jgi:hypothetical protein